MMRTIYIFCILLLTREMNAQIPPPCPFQTAPGASTCATACTACSLDGASGNTGTSLNNAPSGFCGPTPTNGLWFAFIANCGSVTFIATPSNCTNNNGLRLAVYTSCSGTPIGCNGGAMGQGSTPVSVTVGTTPGVAYYLFVSGWNGDVCDFSIAVSPNNCSGAQPPPISPIITGPATSCPGGLETYCTNTVNGATQINWTATNGVLINGQAGPVEVPGNQSCVDIEFPSAAGSYQVCAQGQNSCNQSSFGCKTVNTTPITVTIPPFTICAGASVTVCDETFTTSGFHQATCVSYQGCDSNVFFTLNVLPPVISNLGTIQICKNETVEVCGQTFSQPGFHTATCTAQNGCDSTVQFILQVLFPSASNLGTLTRCPGDTLFVCGQAYTQPGIYTKSCTAVNGCDSIIDFKLEHWPPIQTSLGTIALCPGQQVIVCGDSFNQPGNYSVTRTSASGCDSVVVFSIANGSSTTTQLGTILICQGSSYSVCGQSYTQSGSYTKTCTASSGCDSMVQFNLEVLPALTTNLGTVEICTNGSYSVCGQSYTQTGSYTKTCTANSGCDSIVQFSLEVLPALTTNLGTVQICTNGSFSVCGQSYNQSGSYTKTCTANSSCDSIVQFSLEVLPALTTNLGTVQICTSGSFSVCGQSYNQSGSYTKTCTASSGCDSIVQFSLEVLPALTTNLGTVQICANQTYSVCGETFAQPGTYTKLCTAQAGCDSTVQFTLSFTQTILVQLPPITLCNGQTITICGTDYSSPGSYQVSCLASGGCDSLIQFSIQTGQSVTTQLALQSVCAGDSLFVCGEAFFQNGTYQKHCTTSLGCDSLVQFSLLVHPAVTQNLGDIALCPGQQVQICGEAFSTPGSYTKQCSSSTGCDSTIQFNIVAAQPVVTNLPPIQICPGQSYSSCGQTFQQSGNYTTQCTASSGCDSIVQFQLEVVPVIQTTLPNVMLCPGESIQICNQTITSSGTYQVPCTSVGGCDSVVTVTVMADAQLPTVVLPPVTLCSGESYSWCGVNYTGSGQYTDTCAATTGCDTVYLVTIATVQFSGALIGFSNPSSSTVLDGGIVYLVTGGVGPLLYTWLNEQNITVASEPQATNLGVGVYTLIVTDQTGCTGVFGPFQLTAPSSTAPSLAASRLSVYPNPTDGQLLIEVSGDASLEEVHLLSADGKLLASVNCGSLTHSCPLDLPIAGMQILRIRLSDGQVLYKSVVRI